MKPQKTNSTTDLERLTAYVQEVLSDTGSLLPTLLVNGPDNTVRIIILADFSGTTQEKQQDLFQAGRQCDIEAPTSIYFAFEAWTSSQGHPSCDPERREAVVITSYELQTGYQEMHALELIRTSTGEFETLGPEEPQSAFQDNLLPAFVKGLLEGMSSEEITDQADSVSPKEDSPVNRDSEK